MRRFKRHSRSRSRGSRKTRWVGGVFQGSNIPFAAGSPAIGSPYTWVSFWAKWPAGEVDPQSQRVEPSDETLVRTLVRSQIGVLVTDGNILDIVVGLIAFDGGDFPNFYEAAPFTSNSALVAPPNPIIDADDDWIIRQPYHSVSATGLPFQPPSLEERVWTESRAMRKLPPNTGVLAVVAVTNVLALVPIVSLNWNIDMRLAVRSGYTA